VHILARCPSGDMRVERTANDDAYLDFEELLFAASAKRAAQMREHPEPDELQSGAHVQETGGNEGDVK
jgi:hypothetical protein